MSSKTRRENPIRDRDYLLDKDGMIFKVIGDSHPESHHLGYVKYYPDARGDRSLFGRSYRQNSVVSKSFGILADRPECYVYSEMLGCVITGVPRSHVAHHYSARETLRALLVEPRDYENLSVGRDLLAIARHLDQRQQLDLFGVTGSFLVGCANKRSDTDLVCYGKEGYRAARKLFGSSNLIQPYAGENQTLLYLRRAKYMEGSGFDTLLKQEQRKLQGLTTGSGAHINCEPLREDDAGPLHGLQAKEIGEITLLATVTDHSEGVSTPALYEINVERVLSATVDDPQTFASRVRYLRSYLGAYTGAFRSGDVVHVSGKLVHLLDGGKSSFGVELTPWSASRSYIADLTANVPVPQGIP
ncbi:hypothetical protein [Nocardiopsis metallicus]|uniref:Polymerase nucleotidyl transferase domain-containing protein n=1 Tax=Nocardiopsis metallicus TaxID=179819 RepID=A0A840WAG3_9ACTN|nr:hypothetical protein [Nocardiopsis metallicus]MBB5494040.1 hypothetical protein [Nocardiopsis metallicus]